MIIYSWNMLFENKKQDEAIVFINESCFDIFCLQEVPHTFFLRLQSLPYFFSFIEESIVVSKHREFPIYSVTLSKHKIIHQGEILFDTPERTFKIMFTRFFINLFNKEKIIKIQNHKALYVDVQLDEKVSEKVLRIFNLHLSLTYPKRRMEEIMQVMKSYKKGESIVCGDFNILERLHVGSLNWLLGGTLSDWFFYKRERITIESLFKHFDFNNPLRYKSTHPISHSQLDHILVPKEMVIQESAVIHRRYGSDHCPIRVRVEM